MSYRVNIQSPITEDETRKVSANAIIFKNEGDVTAYVDRNWTLKPGAVFQFGLQDGDYLIEQDFKITFDAPNIGTDKKRIEIAEINKTNC